MKNKKNIFGFLILIIFFINNLNAQLLVKNSTTETISICFGWYQDDAGYYITKGWYNVNPGQTISPGLNFTKNDETFYYYATSKTNHWEGKYKLLTKSTAFNIANADQPSTKDANPEYVWKLFRPKTVHFPLLTSKTYTLNLTGGQKESSLAAMDSVANVNYHGNSSIALDSSANVNEKMSPSELALRNKRAIADSIAMVNMAISDSIKNREEGYSSSPFYGNWRL